LARYAIIENQLVVNVIVAEQEFIDAHYPDAVLTNDAVCVGWNYVDNQFILPAPIEQPTE
jgi:hypothetical protein